MKPVPFTDAAGREWGVFDYVVVGVGSDAKRQALPVGDLNAKARAFVPMRWVGPVMVYIFDPAGFHGATSRSFESQLRDAKPIGPPAVDPVLPS
jgi:hypothetical protein